MFIAVHGHPRGVHSDVMQNGRKQPAKPNASVKHEAEQHGPVRVLMRDGVRLKRPVVIRSA